MSGDHPERNRDRAGMVTNPIDPRNPLAGVYLLVMLFDLSEGALRFLVPVFLDERGYGMGQIGATVSAFALATLAIRLPAGFAYQPHRARLLILSAGAASSFAFLAAPFTPSLWLFTACMVVDGLGWGISTTALLGLVMSSRPEQVPARSAMGWYVGFVGMGHALAHVLGGFVGDLLGVRTAMIVLAQLPFLAGVLICLRMPPQARTDPTTVPSPQDRSPTPSGRPRLRVLSAMVGLPAAVWITFLTAVYLNVMNSLMNTFFPVLGLTLGLSLSQIGSLAGIRSGVSAVVRFVAVPVLRYVAPRRLLLPLVVVSAGTTAALPLTSVYALQTPLWVLNGCCRGMLRVSTGTEALEGLAPGQEGLAAAVMNAGLDTGKVLAPVLGGLAAEALGLSTMFHVVPLSAMAVSLLLVIVARGTRRTQTSAR